ncbi:transcriptional repressor LexA [Hutsoniella sourekii]|uniref:transcriptional repressor LexA n=1 Tax=Hutsoniella sourekii TaxID=87650 RepID=UPI00048100A3|nr:transcriptional repressor LexA [Hutsoniella sourekii]
MTTISDKQLSVLRCIYDAIQDNGYPPTVREIGRTVGLASTSTVHGHISRLEQNGYLIKDSAKTRAIELTQKGLDELGIQPTSIPVLGRVAAGSPILAVEEATDFFPIAPDLAHFDSKDLFMLEIVGDSMVNVGILNGDLITVRRQPSVENGEIVVALTADNEATCKSFYKRKDHYILRPENDYMDDIILDEVTILGKVVSLYRQF